MVSFQEISDFVIRFVESARDKKHILKRLFQPMEPMKQNFGLRRKTLHRGSKYRSESSAEEIVEGSPCFIEYHPPRLTHRRPFERSWMGCSLSRRKSANLPDSPCGTRQSLSFTWSSSCPQWKPSFSYRVICSSQDARMTRSKPSRTTFIFFFGFALPKSFVAPANTHLCSTILMWYMLHPSL